MAYYIKNFEASEAAEFKIVADWMKKGYKKTQKGYGPFTYEQMNYALNNIRIENKDIATFEQEQPDYIKPEDATQETSKIPAPRERGRSRPVPSRSSSSSVDRSYCYQFRNATIDTDRGNKLANESRGQVVHSQYGLKRTISLEDLENVEALKARISKVVGNNRSTSMSTIFNKNIVEMWGFIVEGVDYNKVEDTSKLPYTIHTCGKHKIVEVFEKFFILVSHTPTNLVLDFLKSRPVDHTQFLTNMKLHFLANMNVSLNKKEKDLKSLQQKLWFATKEVAEIKFVFSTVEASSNDHFKTVIDKIKDIPAFDRIEFLGSGFIVTTKDLWAEIDDSRVYIGVFEIRLSITDKFVVEYRNIASPCTTRWDEHHPHRSCMGGHYGVIQQALSTLDYYTFILSIVELLQTVNPREKTLQSLIDSGWIEKKPPASQLKRLESWQDLLSADTNIELAENANSDEDADDEEEPDDEND